MTIDNANTPSRSEASAELRVRPERHLIGRAGDSRHVDFRVQVSAPPAGEQTERLPLTLALVLDRSGSMSGEKLPTAKRAALAVLDQLTERDTVAVVIFDDRIDTVQATAPATTELKATVRAVLGEIAARGSTALHEGWLTGCDAITRDDILSGQRLARCFLLTDGQANVGVTDPERIAIEARGIRERAGISTSTFGIGIDYAEELLGPMAEGGSGQFHHLRTPEEIANTFICELGEMLAVALTQARLELEVRADIEVEVISAYAARSTAEDPAVWVVDLGDLLAGEEPHVVVRFGVPKWDLSDDVAIRARLVWMAQGHERATDWYEVRFTYADAAACDAEMPDPEAARVIGEHLADRANREAIRMSKRGDLKGAQTHLRSTSAQLAAYAASAPSVVAEANALDAIDRMITGGQLRPEHAKETYYTSQRRSKGKRDLRGNSRPSSNSSNSSNG
jgi:Mg-chelatase subunit ChlD